MLTTMLLPNLDDSGDVDQQAYSSLEQRYQERSIECMQLQESMIKLQTELDMAKKEISQLREESIEKDLRIMQLEEKQAQSSSELSSTKVETSILEMQLVDKQHSFQELQEAVEYYRRTQRQLYIQVANMQKEQDDDVRKLAEREATLGFFHQDLVAQVFVLYAMAQAQSYRGSGPATSRLLEMMEQEESAQAFVFLGLSSLCEDQDRKEAVCKECDRILPQLIKVMNGGGLRSRRYATLLMMSLCKTDQGRRRVCDRKEVVQMVLHMLSDRDALTVKYAIHALWWLHSDRSLRKKAVAAAKDVNVYEALRDLRAQDDITTALALEVRRLYNTDEKVSDV
ncbi:hypothetical protein GUITHDRAFT_101855 [Guillardia theta CCMP2712]|uniref:Uncharacterized protein n=1 Tax=Guillardia theta (strain CCMP2712) TaxID=905079 RepID=L1JWF5_GUITC|nr:hypothetical protein GUITHDRAFT_101855 [Guillardia theta CCMP2712]EKX52697.1 hypothetical protein GUITHDRAFT_101855 [Guillardia theta CCMP2712]|mmetsp:Transcript_33160/g.104857  ORF Transcript_33160/g.104857 Transcript_33160/m.104857 type:complete len:340 (-) Transcript_33160:768-1787(-)|eukprot:XP_005839677.1 hypothetical protein GUITHDRAFT_101855 [Guillardia theta CCMP2712]